MSRLPDHRDLAPSVVWAEGVAAGRWQDDPAQRAALREFDRIHHALHAHLRAGPLDRLRRWWRAEPPPKGLYLWGGVGRGKTMLMDLFFEHAPGSAKRRLHFHRFMTEVHGRLRALGAVRDPLARVAADLARHCRLLCLDEFFVSDIGDAMILARLLECLFGAGVVLVTTSNTVPDELYRDGLQRQRFLPAIALLQRHCNVLAMDAGADYRLRALTRAPTYLWPLDDTTQAALAACYQQLTSDAVAEQSPLEINGRIIPTIEYCEGVAWFEFAALCAGPRAAADYVEIARDFHTVLLAGVPVFDARRENEAKRFIHLVDALYDHRVNLILSAAAPLERLYQGERLSAEFERTRSRLIEMQTEAYLARPHRP